MTLWEDSEANRMSVRLLRTIPILRVFNEAKAREFYLDYLGFRSISSTGFTTGRRCSWEYLVMG